MQQAGGESALDDESAEGCGGRKVLVEVKRITIAAELCVLLDVFSGEGKTTGGPVSNTDVQTSTSIGIRLGVSRWRKR
jgi:hypothetical protein